MTVTANKSKTTVDKIQRVQVQSCKGGLLCAVKNEDGRKVIELSSSMLLRNYTDVPLLVDFPHTPTKTLHPQVRRNTSFSLPFLVFHLLKLQGRFCGRVSASGSPSRSAVGLRLRTSTCPRCSSVPLKNSGGILPLPCVSTAFALRFHCLRG